MSEVAVKMMSLVKLAGGAIIFIISLLLNVALSVLRATI